MSQDEQRPSDLRTVRGMHDWLRQAANLYIARFVPGKPNPLPQPLFDIGMVVFSSMIEALGPIIEGDPPGELLPEEAEELNDTTAQQAITVMIPFGELRLAGPPKLIAYILARPEILERARIPLEEIQALYGRDGP